MTSELSILARTLHAMVKRASNTPEFREYCNLKCWGEALCMTQNDFDNTIYGKIALNDSFILGVTNFVNERSPAVFERFLQDYFGVVTIRVGARTADLFSESDFRVILNRITEALGKLTGAFEDHMDDGQLSLPEIDTQLSICDELERRLRLYRHNLLQQKTDVYAPPQTQTEKGA